MLELGVIADDLTGGVKVASLLEREGVRCPAVTTTTALNGLANDAEAVVVARKTLLLPPDEAAADARRCAAELLAQGARRLYYKYSALFSSTAKGNIGPVSEALLELTGVDHLLFCPAFPERDVTLYKGRLFVGRNMLHEIPKSRDPVTPMTNSNLVEVLQAQSREKVGLLSYAEMRLSTAERKRFLARQVAEGVRFFLTDVVETQDLARIAELAVDMPVSTGADELPVFLARQWRDQAERAAEPRTLLPPAPGSAAVIAGSCTPKTNRQLARFEQANPIFRIDLVEAARAPSLVDRIAAWAGPRLSKGPIGVSTTADEAEVRRVQRELGRDRAAALADDVLGNVAKRLQRLGVRKFVLAGGETSGAVMASLGIDRVEVAAYDELCGGYCHSATADPVALVLKAGGAGEEDFIAAALDRMRAADAAIWPRATDAAIWPRAANAAI